jgi:hypothetical protein
MTTDELRAKCSPSNILYRGEATDFLHAMDLVQAQCKREKLFLARYGREFPDEKPYDTASLDAYTAAAQRCAREYLEIVRKAEEELARRWVQDADADVRVIGLSLLAREYQELAI